MIASTIRGGRSAVAPTVMAGRFAVAPTVIAGRIAAALAVAALLAGAPAEAGTFRVDPVNIVLAENRAATELRLTNAEAAPVGVRVTALRWTQREGKDVYEPTDDVIASPPIFTVAPRGTQLVRFGLRRRIPGAAYRIIVEEIPQAKAAGVGIRVALKIDLPLYVATGGKPAALTWSVRRAADGTLVAESRNAGGTHAQVKGVQALDSAGRPLGRSDSRGVVLPGSMRAWSLGSATGEAATIVVTTPQGEQRSPVGGARP